MTKKHYRALDAFRGIAALMVALFHFKPDNIVTTSLWVEHAWLFVDFFFVLSGFVIAHNYFYDRAPDLRAFTRARLARLYPLMLYTLLVMLGFETLKFFLVRHGILSFNNPPFSENDAQGFILNLLLLTSFGLDGNLTWNTPAWTIAAEFWVNIGVALLFLWPGARRYFMPLALGLTAAALCGLMAVAGGLDLSWDWGWLRCLYGFAAGMAIYALHRRWPCLRAVALWEIVALCLSLAVLYAYGHVWFAAPPLVFAFAVWVFADERGGIARALCCAPCQFLGRISYSVYLNHVIVAIVAEKALVILFPDAGAALSLAATAAYLVAVVLYSALTYRFIEDPARRALRSARTDK